MADDENTPAFDYEEITSPDRQSLDATLITGTGKRLGEGSKAFMLVGRDFDELDEDQQLRVLHSLYEESGRLAENVHDLRRYLGARIRAVTSRADGK
jgi:hypothetical protein